MTDQGEEISTQSAEMGLDDGEGESGRNRRVESIPTPGQDV
jgi:hypothetical protein